MLQRLVERLVGSPSASFLVNFTFALIGCVVAVSTAVYSCRATHLDRTTEAMEFVRSAWDRLSTVAIDGVVIQTPVNPRDLLNAQEHLKLALTLDPELVEAHICQGALYLVSGKPGDAEREYREAARLSSSNSAAVAGVAQALRLQGKPTAALDFLKRNAEHHIDALEFQLALGDAYTELRQLDEAVTAYKEARRLAPNSPVVVQNLAEAYVLVDKADLARDLLEQLVVTHPDFGPGLASMADLEARHQHWSSATRFFKQALQVQPRLAGVKRAFSEALVGAGEEARRSGDLREAIDSFLQATEEDRRNATAFLLHAEALLEAGQPREAIPSFKKSIDLVRPAEPADYPRAFNGLARAEELASRE